MKHRFIALSLASLLTGCATVPNEQEIRQADYGPYPVQYQSIIEGEVREHLKDPDSAKFSSFSLPTTAWYSDKRLGLIYGYKVCFTVNAKNGFGAYTGADQYVAIINQSTHKLSYGSEEGGGPILDFLVKKLCPG